MSLTPEQAAFNKSRSDAWAAQQKANREAVYKQGLDFASEKKANAAAVQKPHADWAKQQQANQDAVAKSREDYAEGQMRDMDAETQGFQDFADEKASRKKEFSPENKQAQWDAHQKQQQSEFEKPGQDFAKEQAANAKEFDPKNRQKEWGEHKKADADAHNQPYKDYQKDLEARQKEYSPEERQKRWQEHLEEQAQSLQDSRDGKDADGAQTPAVKRTKVKTIITHKGGKGHNAKWNGPQFIEPVKSGSFDTLLGITKGNQAIKAANAINGLMGDGHLQVFHADGGIRISFKTAQLPGEDAPAAPDPSNTAQ